MSRIACSPSASPWTRGSSTSSRRPAARVHGPHLIGGAARAGEEQPAADERRTGHPAGRHRAREPADRAERRAAGAARAALTSAAR